MIDTSLEGAIRGARADEQERLARLRDQLRQLLRDLGRFSRVDIAPIASEARASNLQACGGCDMLLARRIGAELAITGTIIDSIDRNPAQLRNAIYQLARIKLRREARRENPAMNPPEARRLTLALESASVGAKRSGKGSNGCKDGEQSSQP